MTIEWSARFPCYNERMKAIALAFRVGMPQRAADVLTLEQCDKLAPMDGTKFCPIRVK